MNRIFILIIGILLISCGAKNSNTSKNAQKDLARLEEKELMLAEKSGAFYIESMGDDYYKVAVSAPYAALDSAVVKVLGRSLHLEADTILAFGVIDSDGNWVVPAQYQDIDAHIGNGAFVCMYNIWSTDYNVLTSVYDKGEEVFLPVAHHIPMYAVYYDKRIVAGWEISSDFKPITVSEQVCGFMAAGNDDDDTYLYFYPLDDDYISKNVFNHWDEVDCSSLPHYTNYEVKDNLLYMWGGGQTFEAVQNNKNIPQHEKSLLIRDLKTQKVLYNPYAV